jgi:hypothetical protein
MRMARADSPGTLPPSELGGISRRRFIGSIGAGAGALVVGASLPAFASAEAAPALAAGRVATLAALVETLGGLPDSIVDPSRADSFSQEVAEGYPTMVEAARDGIDAWLPLLENGHEAGWFASRSGAERLATLRALLSSADQAPPKAVWVRQAVQGVAAYFDPDLRGGDVPLVI